MKYADPAAMFVAVAGNEVIGVAGLMLDSDRPERAEVVLVVEAHRLPLE